MLGVSGVGIIGSIVGTPVYESLGLRQDDMDNLYLLYILIEIAVFRNRYRQVS